MNEMQKKEPSVSEPIEVKGTEPMSNKKAATIVVMVIAVCVMLVAAVMLMYYTVIAPNRNKKVVDDYRSRITSSRTVSSKVVSKEPESACIILFPGASIRMREAQTNSKSS